MKWLILLLILLAVFGYVAFRYRRQIQAAREVWKAVRQLQQQASGQVPQEKKIDKKDTSKGEPLVRCTKCGKWISEDEAVNPGRKSIYCSTACMEKAVSV